MKLFKKIFYFYQLSMWHFSLAVGEARKPLMLWNETAIVTIFLSTVLGIRAKLIVIVGVYIFFSVLGIIIGRLLVKFGVVAFNQRLGNRQSPELMEILETLKRIEKK